jgi:hypothetical protein
MSAWVVPVFGRIVVSVLAESLASGPLQAIHSDPVTKAGASSASARLGQVNGLSVTDVTSDTSSPRVAKTEKWYVVPSLKPSTVSDCGVPVTGIPVPSAGVVGAVSSE